MVKTPNSPKPYTLKQAVRKARKDSHIKSIEKRGYFFNSGFLMLQSNQTMWDKWILTFYNTGADRVIKVDVEKGKKPVEIGKPSKAANPTKQLLDLKKIKASASRILKKARKEFAKFKQPYNQVIITVSGDPPVWKINFVTKILSVVIVEIDAKNGKVLNSSIESLMKIEQKQHQKQPFQGGVEDTTVSTS